VQDWARRRRIHRSRSGLRRPTAAPRAPCLPLSIALCGAPIEEHHAGTGTRWQYLAEGATYGIPWRCLVPRGVDNLLVAGRCLSSTHDAHASVRSMAQCMAMGYAAGTGMALAVAAGVRPADVSIDRLRTTLSNEGAILE
jgi:hypothetical protein